MDKSLGKVPADNSDEPKISQKSIDTTPPSPLSQNLELSPNDDDSITTSTESSDTFETWTLVMDKQKLKNEANRVEIVKDSSDHDAEVKEKQEQEQEDEEIEEAEECFKDKEQQDSSNDVTADDLSDGISIISESESNGRISPHPYLRDHLQDLNMKFATYQNDDDILHKLKHEPDRQYPTPVVTSADEQHIRYRAGRRSFKESPENKDHALQEVPQSVVEHRMPPILKRGLQGIFYIGVALAILGLIGKIRNPTWQPLSGNPSSIDLEQKLNDMELQNNLMRAEIDLLNKQVKYLNNLNDPQQQKKSGKYKGQHDESTNYKDGKTFKAWSGNGDTLRPVEITKDDLRRPYKCPDGSFKEFAGMCVERKSNDPNIVEQFEYVVDDFKQQSETMQTIEQVAEELHFFTESPMEKIQNFLKGSSDNQQQEQPATETKQEFVQPNEFVRNNPIYEQQFEDNSQQLPTASPPNDGNIYEKCKDKSDRKCYEKEFKRRFDGENRDPRKPYEGHLNEKFDKFKYPKNEKPNKFDSRGRDNEYDEQKENFNKRRYDSKERKHKRNDDSKERLYKRNDDNSKERYQKRDDNSKERFHKRSREYSSKERFQKQKTPDSGEWQEKYMKHRENVRKENEEKFYGDNKNWYIKRGDGRENKRNIEDTRFR